jgi:hypothetical protein
MLASRQPTAASAGTPPRFALLGAAACTGPGVAGFSASGNAGYFDGKVFVSGALTVDGGCTGCTGPSLKIDHPLDPAHKYLQHSFVESPDMLDVYNGNVVTNGKGFATVRLPRYFQVLNKGSATS